MARGGAERRRLPEPYSRPRAGSAQSTEGAARITLQATLTEAQGHGRTDARTDRRSEQTEAQRPLAPRRFQQGLHPKAGGDRAPRNLLRSSRPSSCASAPGPLPPK